MITRALVSVADDDESVREALPDLLRAFGFVVETFASRRNSSRSIDRRRRTPPMHRAVHQHLDLSVKPILLIGVRNDLFRAPPQ